MLTVGSHRVKASVGVGFGEDRNLERKIRRHGNLAENAAIFIAALLFVELAGAAGAIVTGFAIVFAIARVSHAIAFTNLHGSHNTGGSQFYVAARVAGASGTALSGLALGLYLAYSLTTV